MVSVALTLHICVHVYLFIQIHLVALLQGYRCIDAKCVCVHMHTCNDVCIYIYIYTHTYDVYIITIMMGVLTLLCICMHAYTIRMVTGVLTLDIYVEYMYTCIYSIYTYIITMANVVWTLHIGEHMCICIHY